jgi:hypothetical protein
MNSMADLETQCAEVIEHAEAAKIAEMETIVNDGDRDTLGYRPTMRNTCADPGCPSYARPLVDRGYGYPVCETSPWNHDINGIGYDVPMKARYLTKKR